MVVSKMLKLVNSFTKKDIVLEKTLKSYYSTLKFYKCTVNIVYLIQNRIYLGNGYVLEEKSEIEKSLRSNSLRGVTFTTRPELICELENNEIGTFFQLLKHEQKIFGNVKTTKSYKAWIENDIPYQLACCNEETYYIYEFDGATYRDCTDGVLVSVCFDNCDIEDFQEYFINDTLENVQRDFGDWGSYDGKSTRTSKDLDFRTIKI